MKAASQNSLLMVSCFVLTIVAYARACCGGDDYSEPVGWAGRSCRSLLMAGFPVDWRMLWRG